MRLEEGKGAEEGGKIEDTVKKVLALAEEAGRAILEIYSREDFGVTFKDGGSPLTLADTAANDVIVKGLAAIDPVRPVLSEESKLDPDRRSWPSFWMVDPLDGTKEFIKRNGEFTVNIALVEGGSPVMGVVYAPVLGVAYYGAEGLGAFRVRAGSTERIKAGDYTSGTLKVVASRSHAGDKLKGFLDSIGPHEVVSMGSSLKLCLVADGSAHLYPRLGPTMEWDTAAADAVVRAAGGRVTDLEGRPLAYNKEDLLNPFFIVTGDPPFPWREHLGQG